MEQQPLSLGPGRGSSDHGTSEPNQLDVKTKRNKVPTSGVKAERSAWSSVKARRYITSSLDLKPRVEPMHASTSHATKSVSRLQVKLEDVQCAPTPVAKERRYAIGW